MNIEKIITDLLNRDLSKAEAINQIRDILDKFRFVGAIRFEVKSVGFTSENNHAVLEIILPYGYEKIKNKINKGDKIDVSILY